MRTGFFTALFLQERLQKSPMKKCVFALFAMAVAATASAQLPKIGIKGGLNIANISTNSGNVSSRLSGHGGLLVHAHLAPAFALQPEVIYSSQGTKQSFEGETVNWNLDYLNVPIMLQYMFRNGFRVEAGPQVGLLLSAKIKDPSGQTDIKQNLKQADFALGFGLNYLSTAGFGIGGRYNLGLSNINKNAAAPIKNRVAQISLFYMFDNSHKANSR
jgi:hypothetical protein